MAAAPPPPIFAGLPCCCGSLFFGVAGGIILYDAISQYLLSQRIRNTPTSKARSAAVGLVELSGKAKPLEKLTSPVTKSPCAYFEVVGQYYYKKKKSSGWRTFHHELSGKRFFLEDDSGRMLIEPQGASVRIASDYSFQGHLEDRMFFGLLPANQVDKKVLDYLEANPAAKQAALSHSGKNLRFLEYYIAEGDPLYVLGTAEPLEGASSAVANENLIVRKNPRDKMMYITDTSEKAALGQLALRYYVEMFFGLILAFQAVIGIGLGIFMMLQ